MSIQFVIAFIKDPKVPIDPPTILLEIISAQGIKTIILGLTAASWANCIGSERKYLSDQKYQELLGEKIDAWKYRKADDFCDIFILNSALGVEPFCLYSRFAKRHPLAPWLKIYTTENLLESIDSTLPGLHTLGTETAELTKFAKLELPSRAPVRSAEASSAAHPHSLVHIEFKKEIKKSASIHQQLLFTPFYFDIGSNCFEVIQIEQARYVLAFQVGKRRIIFNPNGYQENEKLVELYRNADFIICNAENFEKIPNCATPKSPKFWIYHPIGLNLQGQQFPNNAPNRVRGLQEIDLTNDGTYQLVRQRSAINSVSYLSATFFPLRQAFSDSTISIKSRTSSRDSSETSIESGDSHTLLRATQSTSNLVGLANGLLRIGGSGGALDKRNTNFFFYCNGKIFILDAGYTLLLTLQEVLFELSSLEAIINAIDGIYISHLHGDHISGLIPLAHIAALIDKTVKIYICEELLNSIMRFLQYTIGDLASVYKICPIKSGESFSWENLDFQIIRVLHMQDYDFSHNKTVEVSCHGIMVTIQSGENLGKQIFFTTDTREPVMQHKCDLCFHDCALGSDAVHASYQKLRECTASEKARTWLVHYKESAPLPNAGHDGFAGFAKVGQGFNLADPNIFLTGIQLTVRELLLHGSIPYSIHEPQLHNELTVAPLVLSESCKKLQSGLRRVDSDLKAYSDVAELKSALEELRKFFPNFYVELYHDQHNYRAIAISSVSLPDNQELKSYLDLTNLLEIIALYRRSFPELKIAKDALELAKQPKKLNTIILFGKFSAIAKSKKESTSAFLDFSCQCDLSIRDFGFWTVQWTKSELIIVGNLLEENDVESDINKSMQLATRIAQIAEQCGFVIRFGLHQGEIMVGVLVDERPSIDFVGPVINFASRLAQFASWNEIMFSRDVYIDLGDITTAINSETSHSSMSELTRFSKGVKDKRTIKSTILSFKGVGENIEVFWAKLPAIRSYFEKIEAANEQKTKALAGKSKLKRRQSFCVSPNEVLGFLRGTASSNNPIGMETLHEEGSVILPNSPLALVDPIFVTCGIPSCILVPTATTGAYEICYHNLQFDKEFPALQTLTQSAVENCDLFEKVAKSLADGENFSFMSKYKTKNLLWQCVSYTENGVLHIFARVVDATPVVDLRDYLYKAIPKHVIDKAIQIGDPNIATKYKEAAVLFFDIVNYTHGALEKTVEQNFEDLSKFFSVIGLLTKMRGFWLVQIQGDACLIIGIPEIIGQNIETVKADIEELGKMFIFAAQIFNYKIRLAIDVGEIATEITWQRPCELVSGSVVQRVMDAQKKCEPNTMRVLYEERVEDLYDGFGNVQLFNKPAIRIFSPENEEIPMTPADSATLEDECDEDLNTLQ
jgi:class 3 adenylate cyclase/ribonuclease BN (tRNA processing enzyme)